MIDFSNVPMSLKMAFVLAPFIIGLSGVGISYHIAATRHFDVLCTAFRNSQGLVDDLKYWSTISLGTRTRIVYGVTLASVWPSLGVRQGWLEADDCKNCPLYLKRRLQVSFLCLLIGCAWLFLVWALIESGRL